ncbi:helix-turn-helix domain-containing protein [Flagellimonas sp. CMM7]|nr:helix-turn-helix domain-containing protein [Flagellimonas sp. CMM7]
MSKKQVAQKIGWSEQKLYSRTKTGNPTLDTLKNLAFGLNVEIHELFETSEKYAHWYDKGEWLGINKKYK